MFRAKFSDRKVAVYVRPVNRYVVRDVLFEGDVFAARRMATSRFSTAGKTLVVRVSLISTLRIIESSLTASANTMSMEPSAFSFRPFTLPTDTVLLASGIGGFTTVGRSGLAHGSFHASRPCEDVTFFPPESLPASFRVFLRPLVSAIVQDGLRRCFCSVRRRL